MSTRRPEIVPGSLADRLRAAFDGRKRLTMAELVAAGLALPEDVKAEVQRLRRAGYIRTYGQRKHMNYFWQAKNLRDRGQGPRASAYASQAVLRARKSRSAA